MNEGDATLAHVLDAAVDALGESGLSGVVPVTGVSMRPTLKDGDRILGAFGAREPRWGDILLFRQDGMLVVHRLVGRRRESGGNERLLTRGDGRLLPDPVVDPGEVLGVVVAAERRGVWRGLRGPGGRFYGRMLAWHARHWSAWGALAGSIQDRAARAGVRLPLRSAVWRVDQRLLRIADALFFRIAHPRVDPPPGPPL